MNRAVLFDNQAIAACVLWASGQFSTREIADLLSVREDAVWRTLYMARDTARKGGVIVLVVDERILAGALGVVALEHVPDLPAIRAGAGTRPEKGRRANRKCNDQFQPVFLLPAPSRWRTGNYACRRFSMPILGRVRKRAVKPFLPETGRHDRGRGVTGAAE